MIICSKIGGQPHEKLYEWTFTTTTKGIIQMMYDFRYIDNKGRGGAQDSIKKPYDW